MTAVVLVVWPMVLVCLANWCWLSANGSGCLANGAGHPADGAVI